MNLRFILKWSYLENDPKNDLIKDLEKDIRMI